MWECGVIYKRFGFHIQFSVENFLVSYCPRLFFGNIKVIFWKLCRLIGTITIDLIFADFL